ncbi:hypothetical protein [Xanthocytophaga agilis]|uniref:PIN domain-containing protein n=1 Tax=Xanthocytophaga agilis TaxID=3048010 RepID=A0AAE3UDN7_9BACT|nr:hypothetical protein [Xanthocytophaga agilis]MDJ1502048.1 hypothetical protein [Xanthocytophaga agilis]
MDTLASNSSEVVIKDSCILFDLVDLALIEGFFQLDLVVYTTTQVINEITNETQLKEINEYVKSGKLNINGDGDLETILSLSIENRGLSIADCSVLELALRKNAIIYSADGSLRKVATRKNLQVRGVLWIIEELCIKNNLTVEIALEKLQLYTKINSRAPIKDIMILTQKLSVLK